MSIFREESGKLSAKRTMGIIYMMALLIMFIYKEMKGMSIQSPEIFIGMMITGGSLVGLSIAQYFKKK